MQCDEFIIIIQSVQSAKTKEIKETKR